MDNSVIKPWFWNILTKLPRQDAVLFKLVPKQKDDEFKTSGFSLEPMKFAALHSLKQAAPYRSHVLSVKQKQLPLESDKDIIVPARYFFGTILSQASDDPMNVKWFCLAQQCLKVKLMGLGYSNVHSLCRGLESYGCVQGSSDLQRSHTPQVSFILLWWCPEW